MKKLLIALPVLFIFAMASTALAEDKPKDGKVPGKPFAYLQSQIDELSQNQCTCDISREEFDDLVDRVEDLENQGRCLSNSDCTTDDYCKKLKGDCDGYGTCEYRPQICIRVYIPVCGCDGKTYGNECEAAASGVSIAHDGMCQPPPPDTCQENSECGANEYCEKFEGECNGEGTCQAKPMVCPDVWMPVCGCDGKTYGNSCEAAASGVNIVNPGECQPPPPDVCQGNSECQPGQFCDKAAGDCGGVGECRDKPIACPDVWAPVCGCDGQTYGNECYANAVGVNILHPGECQAPPNICLENFECGPSQMCSKEAGDCGGLGQCIPQPKVCIPVYDPVCGCDGRTYGNACNALSTGVNVLHPGECAP